MWCLAPAKFLGWAGACGISKAGRLLRPSLCSEILNGAPPGSDPTAREEDAYSPDGATASRHLAE